MYRSRPEPEIREISACSLIGHEEMYECVFRESGPHSVMSNKTLFRSASRKVISPTLQDANSPRNLPVRRPFQTLTHPSTSQIITRNVSGAPSITCEFSGPLAHELGCEGFCETSSSIWFLYLDELCALQKSAADYFAVEAYEGAVCSQECP